jgi:hypothetical protein
MVVNVDFSGMVLLFTFMLVTMAMQSLNVIVFVRMPQPSVIPVPKPN